MNIEEAKKFYLKYDGSYFGMAREEQGKYEEYEKLEISKSVEGEWDNEILNTLKEHLKDTGEVKVFDRIYDIAERRHTRERLLILIQSLRDVKYDDLVMNARLSETMLGRKALSERSGMIFWAYDIGEPEIAEKLLAYVLGILNSQEIGADLVARYDRDRKKCYEIATELNINVP